MALNHENITMMSAEDLEPVIDLVNLTMGKAASSEARISMGFHFKCAFNALDDGRTYLIWKDSDVVLGVTGLHHYNWGPRENVWLGWFAVHPESQQQGIGQELFDAAQDLAKQRGFTKLLVETDEDPSYAKAHQFYESNGLRRVGQVKDYYPNSIDLLIYSKSLVD